MKNDINHKYPSVADLRERSRSKIPKFAFEYLDGGCNDDVNLKKIHKGFEILSLSLNIWWIMINQA